MASEVALGAIGEGAILHTSEKAESSVFGQRF